MVSSGTGYALVGLAVLLAAAPAAAGVTKSEFGKLPDGTVIETYNLTNEKNTEVRVMTYGATVTHYIVKKSNGQTYDVVLGFDNLDGYLKGHPFFGSTVGRVANRIAGGKFTLDGQTYTLATNNGPNHLHGGKRGFDKVVWKAEVLNQRPATVRMTYLSPDGEEGYPGNLNVSVTFILDEQGLRFDYRASADKATPVNLTNHSYFNLGGGQSADVLNSLVQINADQYTPVDATLIPTGRLASVSGTPLDFRELRMIGSRIRELDPGTNGYDHNYVLSPKADRTADGLPMVATVQDTNSDLQLMVCTTEPGLQFYTGNFLDGSIVGKGGVKYGRHAGFCLETQHYPDSVNQPSFPTVILRPNQTYASSTRYSVAQYRWR